MRRRPAFCKFFGHAAPLILLVWFPVAAFGERSENPPATAEGRRGAAAEVEHVAAAPDTRQKPRAVALTAGERIEAAWDELLTGEIPQTPSDPALIVEQIPVKKRPAADFLNHFYLQTVTEYLREEVSFSGLPTAAFVIDRERGPIADLTGIPFREAFQPNSNSIYSFINFGTRGWLSSRINTNASVRYRQNLSHVNNGSPFLSILNTFGASRNIELLNGFVEVNGLPTDGVFAGSSLRIGRQYVYGAELAAFDGASFRFDRRQYSLKVFGGRRFSYYSDPDQRALGGAGIAFRLPGNASIEYETLYYVKGSHTLSFHKRFRQDWLLNTYFKTVGSSPVDFSAGILYLPGNSKTGIHIGFFQKLSDKDFFYDYTGIARERDPYNRFTRLNLGPIQRYSQVMLDVRRDLTAQVRAGGAIIVRRLNDSGNSGPFQTSFEDYRINIQTFPLRGLQTFSEFRQRNTDRLSPRGATLFDDVSKAGETRVQDLSGELRYAFREGEFILSGGAFYRRINMQDRFFFIDNTHVRGFLGGFAWRIDQRSRLHFNYNLDDDFFIFRPDIKRAQALRLRLEWNY